VSAKALAKIGSDKVGPVRGQSLAIAPGLAVNSFSS